MTKSLNGKIVGGNRNDKTIIVECYGGIDGAEFGQLVFIIPTQDVDLNSWSKVSEKMCIEKRLNELNEEELVGDIKVIEEIEAKDEDKQEPYD